MLNRKHNDFRTSFCKYAKCQILLYTRLTLCTFNMFQCIMKLKKFYYQLPVGTIINSETLVSIVALRKTYNALKYNVKHNIFTYKHMTCLRRFLSTNEGLLRVNHMLQKLCAG